MFPKAGPQSAFVRASLLALPLVEDGGEKSGKDDSHEREARPGEHASDQPRVG